jgi:hypothetical protein
LEFGEKSVTGLGYDLRSDPTAQAQAALLLLMKTMMMTVLLLRHTPNPDFLTRLNWRSAGCRRISVGIFVSEF